MQTKLQRYRASLPEVTSQGEERDPLAARNAAAKQSRLNTQKSQSIEAQLSQEEYFNLYNLIFKGRIWKTVKLYNQAFLISTVPDNIGEDISIFFHEDSLVLNIKLYILSQSLLAINGKTATPKEIESIVMELDTILVDQLYDAYLDLEKYKDKIYSKINEFCKTPISRMRASVIQSQGGVVTEQRYTRMSEAQWLWHFLVGKESEQEKAKVIQEHLKYLTYFINPEMAKKVDEKESLSEESIPDEYIEELAKHAGENIDIETLKKKLQDKTLQNEHDETMHEDDIEDTGIGMSGGSKEWYK